VALVSQETEALRVVDPEGAGPQGLPDWLERWLHDSVDHVTRVSGTDEVLARVLRGRPRLVLVDARGGSSWEREALALCARLKTDSYAGVVPLVALVTEAQAVAALDAGVDEALTTAMGAGEGASRCRAVLRRSDRDTDVHPSTRLPGALAIQEELERRARGTAKFAVGYVDLDHFKEFNDRYGYHHGDAVIRLVARILHDVVKGRCGETAFVGHIGGDDFLFVLPLEAMAASCDDIVDTFRELSPLQYSEQDRRMGYFFGKDRRGQLHRVSLMSLSIGVVTNQRRQFTHGGEVSAMASEMKAYAKTLPGSVWAVDRRQEERVPKQGSRRRLHDQLDLHLSGERR
jgi:diguanylate cyclase (GGDEF)-like protein